MKYDKNILIVDDVASITDGMCRILKRSFKHCYQAANGIEALKRCEEHDVDIVITDLVMPRMDGLTLVQKLKEQYPDVRVIIVISGEAGDDVWDEVNRMQIKSFTKPLDVLAMEAYLQEVLGTP